MARKPRIHLPGGLYHVIFRGNGGQDVFLTDADYCRFYLLLQEGTFRFGYRVHAFCLMTNHIHLALQVGEIPLSRGMQNISFRYTRWLNWREKRTGHLFQGRYKAVLVDGDRTGRIPVERSSGLPWQGDTPLADNRLDTCTIWQVSSQGARSVSGFVLDGTGEEHRPEFHGAGADPRLLGDDSFMDRCLAGSEETPSRLTPQQITDKVCRAYNIEHSVLQARSQQRIASEARAVAGWLALESGCVTLSDIARLVNRDVGSISSSVRRLTDRLQEEPELARRLLALKAEIEEES